MLIAVATFFAVFDVDLGSGVGDRDVAVASVENLQSSYRLGIGTLDLDLRRAEASRSARPTSMRASTSAISA